MDPSTGAGPPVFQDAGRPGERPWRGHDPGGGWTDVCRLLTSAGIQVCITSNFAKRFSPEEVDALARMYFITISVDTSDPQRFAALRCGARFETVADNMRKVQARAADIGAKPRLIWQATLTALVPDVLKLVRDGLNLGVGGFTFGNLVPVRGMPVKHISELPIEQLLQFIAEMHEAVALIRAQPQNLTCSIQPGIEERINARLVAVGKPRVKLEEPNNPEAHVSLAPLVPEGVKHQTRLCVSPWTRPYILSSGDVWPCCWWYDQPVGSLREARFREIWIGPSMRRLRYGLLHGELPQQCRKCPSTSWARRRELLDIVRHLPKPLDQSSLVGC